MSKHEGIVFTCDTCDDEAVITDFSENHSLPPNWLHLVGTVDNAYAFEVDLCPTHAAKLLRLMQKEL